MTTNRPEPDEIEIVGLQLPYQGQAALVLRRRVGRTVFVVGLSGHQVDALQAAMCRCRAAETPAALAVAAALDRPVAAVALALPAGSSPRAWLLLDGDGREPGVPSPAPLPVRVDPIDALEAVVRAGCRLVVAHEGDVDALCRSWPGSETGAAGTSSPPPARGGLEVPAAFRAALAPPGAPDPCDADREQPGESAGA